MTDTMFFAPHKAMAILVDGGLSEDAAIGHLVRLKDTEFCVKFDKTSYFDPRELNRIVKAA